MGSRAGDGQEEATAGQFLVQVLQNPRHHQSPAVFPHPQNPNPNGFNPRIDSSRVENRGFDYLMNGNNSAKGKISQVDNVGGLYSSPSSRSSRVENRGFDYSLNLNDSAKGKVSQVVGNNVDGLCSNSSSSRVENRGFDYSLKWNDGAKERISQLGNVGGLCSSTRSNLTNGKVYSGSDIKFENSFDGNRSARGNVGSLRGGELEGLRGSDINFENSLDLNQDVRGNVGGWRSSNGLGKEQGSGGSYRAVAPPSGFASKTDFGGNMDNVGNRWSNLEKGRSSVGRNWKYNGQNDRVPSSQLENPRINSAPYIESLIKLHADEYKKIKESKGELDDLLDQFASSLLGIDEGSERRNSKEKAKGSRDKDYRSDERGQWILAQRIRIMKRQTACRMDIDTLNAPFLAIYKSLIPPEEVKEKQEKLLIILGSLMKKEWPEAHLYVYGSCASSFGFSKSDIDICLVIQNMDITKSQVLLKLAKTLELNNFQNVQAITHARVPIVKLMDPNTGISCDICVNNILAVINTKLLRDYARIDGRLRQLAFIVKHWAKRRGVNETYRGTLSSYAYVLMCINFLQQRKPAILPCLQGMEPTYSVTVENTECAYFNEVDKLNGFGAPNGESIAHLVWSFFNYWAYYHDYMNDVVSVRTGHTLSKHAKDWTRRIGNDRHLICIEDPFVTTHDLGRVVDMASIRVLREEFERAAQIMQNDSEPCTKLFEPYVPT